MTEPITITHATSADRAELERLAELDSGHVPAAPHSSRAWTECCARPSAWTARRWPTRFTRRRRS